MVEEKLWPSLMFTVKRRCGVGIFIFLIQVMINLDDFWRKGKGWD